MFGKHELDKAKHPSAGDERTPLKEVSLYNVYEHLRVYRLIF